MKKKMWLIPIIILLFVLVIPIPTGMYWDGGTMEFTALTYKIVKWNRMYANSNTYNKLKIYPFPMNMLSIGDLFEIEREKEGAKMYTYSGPFVLYGDGDAKISLNLIDGWQTDTYDSAGEFYSKEEIKEGIKYFGIEIWPYGHEDGKIKVEYCPYFGVCGTGLSTKKITIGDYEASMGIYDNSKMWSFIALTGEAQRDYVILNEGAEEWWSDYGDEAMAILDTLLVGDDIADTNN